MTKPRMLRAAATLDDGPAFCKKYPPPSLIDIKLILKPGLVGLMVTLRAPSSNCSGPGLDTEKANGFGVTAGFSEKFKLLPLLMTGVPNSQVADGGTGSVVHVSRSPPVKVVLAPTMVPNELKIVA